MVQQRTAPVFRERLIEYFSSILLGRFAQLFVLAEIAVQPSSFRGTHVYHSHNASENYYSNAQHVRSPSLRQYDLNSNRL